MALDERTTMPRVSKKADKPTGKTKGRKIPAEEWDQFFEAVISSGGNVSRACERMRVSRVTVYDRRDSDPEFAARLEQARDRGTDALEDEALRRAFEGVEEPVGFFQGVSYETRTNYSDALIQFLLKGNRPNKFRERISTDNINLNAEVSGDKYEELRSRISAKLLGDSK